MPTITASEVVLMRQMAQGVLNKRMADSLDELSPSFFDPTSTNLEDFTMRKLGKKLYGFYYKDRGRCVAKYAGSYTSAQKKFKVLLITRRLKK